MTIKELKEVLNKYSDDAKVTVFDESYGFIDATKVFDNVAIDKATHQTSVVVRIY